MGQKLSFHLRSLALKRIVNLTVEINPITHEKTTKTNTQKRAETFLQELAGHLTCYYPNEINPDNEDVFYFLRTKI